MQRRADDAKVQREERDALVAMSDVWGSGSGTRIDRLLNLLVAVGVGQLLVCGVLIVVSLLAGPSDWIRPPSFFVQYSLQVLSILVAVLVWMMWRCWRCAGKQLGAERRAGGPPGGAAADS